MPGSETNSTFSTWYPLRGVVHQVSHRQGRVRLCGTESVLRICPAVDGRPAGGSVSAFLAAA